jgi:hypothetical protein
MGSTLFGEIFPALAGRMTPRKSKLRKSELRGSDGCAKASDRT